MMIVAPAIAVPMALAVPVMVVFNTAALPLPVAAVVMTALVARNDPDGACIRRTRPVAPVPGVAAVDGIPVAVHPGVLTFKLWFGAWRPNRNHSRCGWRTDHNAHGDLTECAGRTCQERAGQH